MNVRNKCVYRCSNIIIVKAVPLIPLVKYSYKSQNPTHAWSTMPSITPIIYVMAWNQESVTKELDPYADAGLKVRMIPSRGGSLHYHTFININIF